MTDLSTSYRCRSRHYCPRVSGWLQCSRMVRSRGDRCRACERRYGDETRTLCEHRSRWTREWVEKAENRSKTMRFFGKCPRCGSPQQWDAPTVDDRPPCPGCGFKADGARIDKQEKQIEDARPSGEAATGTMFGENP